MKKSFSLLSSLFFMWGFITVMNDVLINTFKSIFDLSSLQSNLVQFAFFGAYFVVSFIYFIISMTSGKDPINTIGYKKGMGIALVVCSIGCFMFYPAAQIESYPLFLAALFVLASGVTFLQICANPYAAILGTEETASSRLNLVQGLNSLGTTLGPLIGVFLIFRVFSDGSATVDSVGKTYLLYGGLFVLLSVLIFSSKLPSFKTEGKIEKGLKVLSFKQLRLGILAIFCYVGAEVAIGSNMVDFFMEPSIGGLKQEVANLFLAYYWGGAMIGRFAGSIALGKSSESRKRISIAMTSILVACFLIFITSVMVSYRHSIEESAEFVLQFPELRGILFFGAFVALNYFLFLLGTSNAGKTLSIFSLAVIGLLAITIFGTGQLAFWAIIAIGLFNSIMWSNIFTLAIRGLGELTSQGSSLLVMAVAGGAVLPLVQGALIDEWGIQLSFIVPLIPYLYLFYYGIASSNDKPKTQNV